SGIPPGEVVSSPSHILPKRAGWLILCYLDHPFLHMIPDTTDDLAAVLTDFAEWPGAGGWVWSDADRERTRRFIEGVGALRHRIAAGTPLDAASQSAFLEAGTALADWQRRLVEERTRLGDRLRQLDEEIKRTREELDRLHRRQVTYPIEVERLKALLEERLAGRSPVIIFCERMEVRDEEWRNAIEGYLNTRRFDLLVAPEVFGEALRLYEREKKARGIEGVGLVDTEKERRYLGTARRGSLAEELETHDPLVQAHIDHLLGQVMKADDEAALRAHRTAVTRTGMVYHNFVARQLRKKTYEEPFIGEKAIPRQIERRKEALIRLRADREGLRAASAEVEWWEKRLSEKVEKFRWMKEHLTIAETIGELRTHLAEAEGERAVLLSSDLYKELERLEADYRGWRKEEQKLKEENAEWTKKASELKVLRDHAEADVRTAKEALEQATAVVSEWLSAYGAYVDTARERLKEAWGEEAPSPFQAPEPSPASARRPETATPALQETLARKIDNWENNRRGNLTRSVQAFQELVRQRTEYNLTYGFVAPADAPDNAAFDRLFEQLEQVDLPAYREKAEAARRQSEEEFKASFVFQLREALQAAKSEFEELNYALRHFPFSDDRYAFEVKAHPRMKAFYDAVMDPFLLERDEVPSLFAPSEDERAQVLAGLFERLVRGEEGDLETFTNYQNYLDFDLVISNSAGSYRFSKYLREKSGGETQTPFYIAILASFYHLYRSRKTLRLVVFDEAFNKMDEARIEASLKLIKQLELQLIAVAPDEKMQHMFPHMTTTLVVSRVGYRSFVDPLFYVPAGEAAGDDRGEVDADE
ncbi:SbcC/MukB-like Walker B domain-containing protein, partial [Hydrogenibacillus schlegelii]|uniref:SbcC/MukB-like Walker B domain-containing protein n=2 Tax=Hydrogenibacillus schlegelii TaxID=1484 RepID=UPI0039E920B2